LAVFGEFPITDLPLLKQKEQQNPYCRIASAAIFARIYAVDSL
jgi:hypothetical protein